MAVAKLEMQFVVWHYVRNHFEHLHDEQHLPVALKYLILKFSKSIIGCKLLTLKEDMEFFQLLLTKLPNIRKCDLLYRASDNGYSIKQFHSLCDNKDATITIIESNHGNIFGGYTSKSWQSHADAQYVKDKNAFLFLIKSERKCSDTKLPVLYEIKDGWEAEAIFTVRDQGPSFGNGHDICIRGKCNKSAHYKGGQYCYTLHSTFNYDMDDVYLCGNHANNRFHVIDYAVFKVW